MWLIIETPEMVDITPRGEEEWHIRDVGCTCRPRQSRDVQQRLMIIHNSWDGREGFEKAEAALPAGYRSRKAA